MLSVTAGRGPSEQQQQQQQQPRMSGHTADVAMDLKKQMMQNNASLEHQQDQDMAEEEDPSRGVGAEGGEQDAGEEGFNVDADMQAQDKQHQQQVQEILGQKIHDGGAVKYTVRWDNGDITEKA
ncbi:hypothetical protein BGW42_001749 [Actinomortierella wolfii]|nr:hypothetical protein BGW42_001749 [Actinomortierella wolfii]